MWRAAPAHLVRVGSMPAVMQRLAGALTVLVLAALYSTMTSGDAAAQVTPPTQGTVKAQHGDWQLICKPPPPGAKNEVCALVQSVTAEDRRNVGLTIYYQRFAGGQRVLRVFAPLGVLLPTGLGLKIDGKDVGRAPFVRCHSFACYSQVDVDEKLLAQLRSGKTAIFIIFQTEEAGIGIPVSLSGFMQGFAALEK